MRRSGVADLPLHGGRCPPWLFERMRWLSAAIVEAVVSLFSPEEFLRRVADPHFFQSLGCLLGFDWHSSGLTTTLCAALKEGVQGKEKALGLYVCGGKGATSKRTPAEIEGHSHKESYSFASSLIHASKLSAKVDNTALQDGFQLYHHSFFFSSSGKWAVVQQGMNTHKRYARRYHWLGEKVYDYTCEPHSGICAPHKETQVLNLVASESYGCRKAIVALGREPASVLIQEIERAHHLKLPRRHWIEERDVSLTRIEKAIRAIADNVPASFADVISIHGVGPRTIRALSLTAEVILGAPPSFRDPATYSYAHGGKDGYPFPVDRNAYQDTIHFVEKIVRGSTLGAKEKENCFKQLGLLSTSGTAEIVNRQLRVDGED